jgi:hypothetical protein
LDDKYNFAKINPKLTDITSCGFVGYLESWWIIGSIWKTGGEWWNV